MLVTDTDLNFASLCLPDWGGKNESREARFFELSGGKKLDWGGKNFMI